MTKSIRKYQKWLMVGFGVLLMMTWLWGPTMRGISNQQNNRTVGKLDGKKITAADMRTATKEIQALDTFEPGIVRVALGIEDRDPVHWLLLTREAQAAGFVGETQDGHDFMELLARGMAEQQLSRNFQLMMEMEMAAQKEKDPNAARRAMMQQYIDNSVKMVPLIMRNQSMTDSESDMLFAKLRGVDRLIRSYRSAARLSDRQAVAAARQDRDSALVDSLFIPASLSSPQIPDPDEATLQAHFEKYKNTKPGEGEFGIGYIHPKQVKIEWMMLDHKAMTDAIRLDNVEVRKRYQANRAKYTGDLATERAGVEADMKAEAVEKAMDQAQRVIQSEVLKVTRKLEPDGKYKKLPAGWEQTRPRFDTIAPIVVAELKKDGIDIPLPTVVSKGGQWMNLDEVQQLPGIGLSGLRQGGITTPFISIIGSTRELGGEPGPIPVQVSVPVAESYLTGSDNSRFYITVLGTRGEAAPDNLDEVREKAIKDYKLIQAFEKLKLRADEFKQMAIASGLDAVAAAVAPPAPPAPTVTPDQPKPPAPTTPDAPKVRKDITITRQNASDANLNDETIRTLVIETAATLDPLTPYGQVDAQKSTLAIPTAKHLGVAVLKIEADRPMTQEDYRMYDLQAVGSAQQKELPSLPGSDKDPFSLANLLKRHDYSTGDARIRTVEQLKRRDKSEG